MGDTREHGGRPASAGSGEAFDRAGSDLRATATEAKAQAGEAASRVRDEAAGAYADVKAEAAGVVEEARQRAAGLAEQQKHAGAEWADGLARAVHRAADELQGTSPQIARYVREGAASVHRLSRDVRGRGVGELLGDVEGIARRQPLAFFGVATLAGFALSRFLKSSAPGVHGGGHQAAQHTAHREVHGGGGYAASGVAAPSASAGPSAAGGTGRVGMLPTTTGEPAATASTPAAGSSTTPVVG